jgi:hypothetical protein
LHLLSPRTVICYFIPQITALHTRAFMAMLHHPSLRIAPLAIPYFKSLTGRGRVAISACAAEMLAGLMRLSVKYGKNSIDSDDPRCVMGWQFRFYVFIFLTQASD